MSEALGGGAGLDWLTEREIQNEVKENESWGRVGNWQFTKMLGDRKQKNRKGHRRNEVHAPERLMTVSHFSLLIFNDGNVKLIV